MTPPAAIAPPAEMAPLLAMTPPAAKSAASKGRKAWLALGVAVLLTLGAVAFVWWRRDGREVVFPSKPTKLAQVRGLIDEHLVPGGERRGLEFLKLLTEFHNRYYTGPETVNSSMFVAQSSRS
jgi:hypothetical protein